MRAISGKRMCRLIEARGWQLARINGSHHIYRHKASKSRITIPVHGNTDLKSGTQHSIMRTAGLTDADL